MDFTQIAEALLPELGQKGVDALAQQLDELLESTEEPWKKTVLGFVANGVEEYGVEGIRIAVDNINKLLENKDPDLSWTHLDVASDLLAHMQNDEADRKAQVRDYLDKVGKVLGPILEGVLKSLIS